MGLGRLDMQTDAAQCLEEATDLLRQRQRFDFSYIWEATEADVALDLARYHALAGRVDEAIGCLRRALECGWSNPQVLDHDPLLDGLRRQAEFASLRATLAGR